MKSRDVARVIVIVVLFGCSKPPSEKEVVDSMISWIGTGDVAAQAWLNHTTFDKYTRETLELASKMLDDQSEQLKEAAPSHSPAIDSAAASAKRAMTSIANLVAANDAPDVPAQLDSLRAAKKIVLSSSDSLAKRK